MHTFYRFRYILLVLIGLSFTTGRAQSVAEEARQEIFQAYRHDDAQRWEKALQHLRQHWQAAERPTNELLLELAVAEYGMIGLCQQSDHCSDVKSRMNRLAKYLEQLEEDEDYRGRVLALQGGLIGLRINEAPWQGLTLASESLEHLRKGTSVAPQQPMVWVELGNYCANAPELFGGDEKEAVQAYQRAVNLFEKQPESQRHCWLYLHALASLGRTQADRGHTEQARQTYQKALEVAPGFRLVKNELLPELDP